MYHIKSTVAAFLVVLCIASKATAATDKVCPNDEQPWKNDDGEFRRCDSAKHSEDCPSGFTCTKDDVCCPLSEEKQNDDGAKRERATVQSNKQKISDEEACGKNGKAFRSVSVLLTQSDAKQLADSSGTLQTCAADEDCLPPSLCLEQNYCCLLRLDQEPPPVGCPFGTRPLKNSQGTELTCSPNNPNSCPGDTQCYQDSVTNTYHCCGKDPGEGCPTGSRAVRDAQSKVVTCTPGNPNQACPRGALCQWSYLIDRYQCCEKDNGCPAGQAPLLTPSQTVQACKTDGTQNCPSGYQCSFNFWSAEYQCCGRDTAAAQCPVGQVPYVEYQTGSTRRCANGSGCPAGYTCIVSSGMQICCGAQGTCPNNLQVVTDSAGRATSCSPIAQPAQCTAPATCTQSVGAAAQGQFLCCQALQTRVCASGRTPVPASNAQVCTLGLSTCPAGSQCEPSTVSGVNICCSTSGGGNTLAECPSGWSLMGGVRQYCNPTGNNCAGTVGAYCLAAPNINGQYLCCVSGTSGGDYTCPVGTPVRLNGNQYLFCGTGIGCSAAGSICEQASNAPGTFLCCYTQAAQQSYICPNNAQPYRLGSSYQFCSTGLPSCPSGYICQRAVNSPSTSICCTGGAGSLSLPYQCPSPGTPVEQNGHNQFCALTASNACALGSTCRPSSNVPSVTICCQGNQATPSYQCPRSNSIPYRVGTQYATCSVFNPQCPTGYECNAALGNANVYICCSKDNPTTYTCPAGYNTVASGNANAPIFCNPQQPTNCPAGTRCLTASNAPQYSICCSSGNAPQNLCPNGQVPLLLTNQQPQYCTSPGAQCSNTGYNCQFSSALSRYICCSDNTGVARCPNGAQALLASNGLPQTCLTSCVNGYDCVQSTRTGLKICCLRQSQGTRPTRCANTNRTPHLSNGRVQTCNVGQLCPAGSLCEASDVPGISICCNTSPTSDSAQCPIGWQGYKIGNAIQACTGLTDNRCPANYACTQSTIQNTFLCCRFGSGTTLACYNGVQAYTEPTGNARICSPTTPNCPNNYQCLASTQAGTFICCASSANYIVCPGGAQPAITTAGNTQYCSTPGSTFGCANNYVCRALQTSNGVSANRNGCCPQNPSNTVCRPGTQPYLVNGIAQTCFIGSTNICPSQYDCVTYNSATAYCCTRFNSVPQNNARCIGRSTKLTPQELAIACQTSSQCGSGYECSLYTTTGQYICCSAQSNTQAPVCPNNRDPYHDPQTREYLYCDSTNYNCPNGFVCKRMINSGSTERYICCSEIPSCQRGWQPYINPTTGIAQTCSPFDQNRACQPTPGFPYKCQASTVPNTYLCCLETAKYGTDNAFGDAANSTGDGENAFGIWHRPDVSGQPDYGPQIGDPGSDYNFGSDKPNQHEPVIFAIEDPDSENGEEETTPRTRAMTTTQASKTETTTDSEWTVWG